MWGVSELWLDGTGRRYEVMRQCWEEEPEDRPSFKQLFDNLKVSLTFSLIPSR